jgi:DNA-binding beta-propeller fold protein YncE
VWLNSRPLTKQDLKGKFVLLDFWTYCCINCMHVLPELKKLERAFANNLVVIGVHSAKFQTEKETENIRAAILRYEIEHPVINDADHSLWNTYGVNSWPTIVLIDPEGNFVGSNPGEFKAEAVANILHAALPYYREHGLLDEKPLAFDLELHRQPPTPLRYPGKILADELGQRLFISDSNHNRIVIATLEGKLLDVIGSGQIGREDGDYATATFNHPQGCALDGGDILYVADTENHLLRKVDLKAKRVTTVAGTGEQASNPWPGWDGSPLDRKTRRWVGPPRQTPLNSPWALWVHKGELFIAMAGCHQIWKMPLLKQDEIGPYAGNAREDIVDGPLLPTVPFGRGSSSFAQPSGLSSDGTWLFVADSEGSSIRAVPLAPGKQVRTVVGTEHLPFHERLFTFGDVDGPRQQARFQHCLEVVYVKGKIYVADTYNHKIKVVDALTGQTQTLAGTGQPGTADDPPQFHEPAGLAYAAGKLYVADTNNHLIRTIDLSTGKVATWTIEGLTPPRAAAGGR